ncbi:hypothetical protein B0H14DRAFT_3438342 [Mycena olivaceomarginata]|nr:hypothetical protein B0H14DRAFT_3438342 [Mycena olivaceomarginata]
MDCHTLDFACNIALRVHPAWIDPGKLKSGKCCRLQSESVSGHAQTVLWRASAATTSGRAIGVGKYSLEDKCVDGQRKERKKGIKRGPYKRRPREGDSPPASFASGGSSAPAVAAAEWTTSNGALVAAESVTRRQRPWMVA